MKKSITFLITAGSFLIESTEQTIGFRYFKSYKMKTMVALMMLVFSPSFFAQVNIIDLAAPYDNVLVVEDKLYYSSGGNLYSYDGVSSSPITVDGGVVYYSNREPDYLVEYNGDIYFRGNFGSQGNELLKYDIDLDVVTLVEDIKPTGSSGPGGFVVCDDKLFFLADDDSVSSFKQHLYVYDGTTTTIIHDPALSYLNVPLHPTAYGDTLLFAASKYSTDIYRYHDGVLSVEVDFGPLNITDANDLYVVDDRLYFTGWDRSKLYVHNLTTGVTQYLWAIQPYSTSTLDFEYIAYNGEYYFVAEDPSDDVELFKHTLGGSIIEIDIDPSTEGGQPRNFFVWQDSLYFKADDGLNGMEMYRYFNNSHTRVTNHGVGTSGLSVNTQDYLVLDSMVYVSEHFPSLGVELGYFDGDSVYLAADINTFSTGSTPYKITACNDKIYCIATEVSSSPFYLMEYCPRKFKSIDTTVCTSFTSPSGNYTWEYTGVYVDTIAATTGCDSVITFNLTVLSQNYHDINEVLNYGETISILGVNFSTDSTNAVVTHNNLPVYNCDQDILVNTVLQPEIIDGSPNGWAEFAKLTSEYREDTGEFGSDISVFKDHLIIGARNEDADENGANPLTDAGAVYFYHKDASDHWVLSQKICAPNRSEDDNFGESVSLQGNTAVVGAPGYVAANGHYGAIYIYEYDGSQWNYVTFFEAPTYVGFSLFAKNVAVSNNTIMVTASNEAVNTVSSRGKVFIYTKSHINQSWMLKQDVYGSNFDDEFNFGCDVSIYNDYAVVGNHYDRTDENGLNSLTACGAVFIFYRDSLGFWHEIQKITASDRDADDHFGLSVSISKDKLIVGAPYKGISGNALDDEGAAYIFEKQTNGLWVETQKLLSDDVASDENQIFGFDVAMSGNFAIVSAPQYDFDSNGQNIDYFSGASFVFERNSAGSWTHSDKLTPLDREDYDIFGTKVAICDNDLFSYSPGDDQDENGLNYINNSGSVYHFSIDVLAPVPDATSLPTVQDMCEVATLTAPTATDNDGSVITGTTNTVLPITSSQYITWTYTDGAGNQSTQSQYIDVIEESISPILNNPNLPDVITQCAVNSLPVPIATYECTGTVNGVPNVTFPITSSVTIEWEYSNGGPFSTVQFQDVIINPDSDAPVPAVSPLSDIASECPVTPAAPTATDNCSGTVTGTPDISFPVSSTGTTTITWTYDDGNGNTSTQTQEVTINPIDNGVTQLDATTLSANATGYAYQWVDCDNGFSSISGATNQTFLATTNGNYAVVIGNGTCDVISTCTVINSVGIEHPVYNKFYVYPNPASGTITLDLLNMEDVQNKTARIINNLGQLVLSIEVGTKKIINVDISDLSPGSYFVIIEGNEYQYIQKLIIEN